jgi:hypothetical protein
MLRRQNDAVPNPRQKGAPRVSAGTQQSISNAKRYTADQVSCRFRERGQPQPAFVWKISQVMGRVLQFIEECVFLCRVSSLFLRAWTV